MQHSDITYPTVTRQPGEKKGSLKPRIRAERHRLTRVEKQIVRDYGTGDALTEHNVNSVAAFMNAVGFKP